jgi:hypothetical protein
MRASQLKIGEAFDVKRYSRCVYVGFDRDPMWSSRPYVFTAEGHGDTEFHFSLRDVLRPWAEAEAEQRQAQERQDRVREHETRLIAFLDRYGLRAKRRSLADTDSDYDVRLTAYEDLDQSVLEIRFSALRALLEHVADKPEDYVWDAGLADQQEVRGDLVAAGAEKK